MRIINMEVIIWIFYYFSCFDNYNIILNYVDNLLFNRYCCSCFLCWIVHLLSAKVIVRPICLYRIKFFAVIYHFALPKSFKKLIVSILNHSWY